MKVANRQLKKALGDAVENAARWRDLAADMVDLTIIAVKGMAHFQQKAAANAATAENYKRALQTAMSDRLTIADVACHLIATSLPDSDGEVLGKELCNIVVTPDVFRDEPPHAFSPQQEAALCAAASLLEKGLRPGDAGRGALLRCVLCGSPEKGVSDPVEPPWPDASPATNVQVTGGRLLTSEPTVPQNESLSARCAGAPATIRNPWEGRRERSPEHGSH